MFERLTLFFCLVFLPKVEGAESSLSDIENTVIEVVQVSTKRPGLQGIVYNLREKKHLICFRRVKQKDNKQSLIFFTRKVHLFLLFYLRALVQDR